MKGHVFDGHCDVLFRLWEKGDAQLFFTSAEELHCSFQRLKKGQVKVQTMAIFVPPEVPQAQKLTEALRMIDIFHHHILRSAKGVRLIKDRETLERVEQDDALFVILSMEGAEPIGDNLLFLRTFYELGVRSMGLTWNHRNMVADGVGEPNPGGLSQFGIEVVEEMNRLKMAIDISHLAEPAFWDVISRSRQPVMASHCNARKLYEHRRNLTDEQLKAIFEMKGLVGINFVPYFLGGDDSVSIESVLYQIDHMVSLGGEDYIGFGSDFDGIDSTVQGLEHSGKWPRLIETCQKHFSADFLDKILFTNWKNYYLRVWSN